MVVAFSDDVLTACSFLSGARGCAGTGLLALGVANAGASMLQGFLVSSARDRSAIAVATGRKTQVYSLLQPGPSPLALVNAAVETADSGEGHDHPLTSHHLSLPGTGPEAEAWHKAHSSVNKTCSWHPGAGLAKAAGQGHRQRPGRLRRAHDSLRQAHLAASRDQLRAKPCKQAQQYRGGADRNSWTQTPRHRRPPPPRCTRPRRQGGETGHRPDRMR